MRWGDGEDPLDNAGDIGIHSWLRDAPTSCRDDARRISPYTWERRERLDIQRNDTLVVCEERERKRVELFGPLD